MKILSLVILLTMSTRQAKRSPHQRFLDSINDEIRQELLIEPCTMPDFSKVVKQLRDPDNVFARVVKLGLQHECVENFLRTFYYVAIVEKDGWCMEYIILTDGHFRMSKELEQYSLKTKGMLAQQTWHPAKNTDRAYILMREHRTEQFVHNVLKIAKI